MKRRKRIYYTDTQKALMWDRWQKGDSLHRIAALFDRHHPSIQRIIAETGGIRPRPKRRSPCALTLAEREEIVITRHGKPAGILVGFAGEDDWFDYRLENDPRFLNRIAQARESLRAGKGVQLEDID